MTLVQRLTSIAYDYQDGDPKSKARTRTPPAHPRCPAAVPPLSPPPRPCPLRSPQRAPTTRSLTSPRALLSQRRTPHAEDYKLVERPGPIEYLARPISASSND